MQLQENTRRVIHMSPPELDDMIHLVVGSFHACVTM